MTSTSEPVEPNAAERGEPEAMRPAASLVGVTIRRPASGRTASREPEVRPAPSSTPAKTPHPAQPQTVARRPEPVGEAGSRPDTMAAPTAIIDYWEQLAGERFRPDIAALVHATIARQWPNSLLLRVVGFGRRPTLEVAHMFAPPATEPDRAIPIDAMSVDWIMELGREAVVSGSPLHETDAMPTGAGTIGCGVIVLPFGGDTAVDHVLCHLYRAEPRRERARTTPAQVPETNRSPGGRIRRLFGV